MNNQLAYALADWAYRIVCPAFLEFQDGRRTFPDAARLMREVPPIVDSLSASSAIARLTRDVIPGLVEFRDGQITVPLKQCHWLLQACVEIESGNALPADYGSRAFKDLALAMDIEIPQSVWDACPTLG